MISTIVWVGFSQSLFAAILVAAKKNLEIQDRILSAWLFLLAIEFLTCGLDFLFWGIPLLSSSFLLFNPAFFLYVNSLTQPNFKLKKLQLLHLLPFLIFEAGSYILQEKYSLNNFFETDSTQWFRFSFSIASVISWVVYNYLSAAMVFHHRRKLESEFSNIEGEKKLKWLIFIVVFYNLFCGFALIIALITAGFTDTGLTQYTYNYTALLVLIYILGFNGLRQRKIFIPTIEENTSKAKYANSLLSDEKKILIKDAVINYIENNKPYLNPDFNMSFLSEKTGFPKHQITEVLNTMLGKNFFKLVNEYRVEDVKKQLAKNTNNYSIEGIGYECGFNNKSSFFAVFKSITGYTPLQYKEIFEKS